MRQLRAEGMTVREISLRMKRGRAAVTRYTSDLGPMPNGWQHRTAKQEQDILLWAQFYLTQKEIAARVGVSTWTVLDVLQKNGVKTQVGKGAAASRRYAIDEDQWRLIFQELYVNQRLPLGEVARRCNINISTVRRRLRRLGFTIRTQGEQQLGCPRPRRKKTVGRSGRVWV